MELAWVLARADPDKAPSSLRRVLGFAKLPRSALGQVQRAVEADADFRALAAAAAEEEDDVGRPSWLWLHRPEGWEEELAAIEAELEGEARKADEERAERSSAKRLAKAEAALAAAKAATDRAERAAADARSLLDAERRARRVAEVEVDRLRERVTQLEADRDRSAERAGVAETTIGSLREERTTLRQRVDELERRLAVQLDRAGLVEAVDAARVALDRASSLLDVTPPQPRRERPPAAPRRKPTPLPGGVFDDAPEAAEHLVRVDGVTLLVDGYNVAKLRWPDEALDEQRLRLVDALEELAGRAGCSVHVVFDGGPSFGPSTRPPTRSVQVTFSPEGVTADDVVLDLVDDVPPERPVVVASSDREVRDGARARGANTVSSAQLLTALGRYGAGS